MNSCPHPVQRARRPASSSRTPSFCPQPGQRTNFCGAAEDLRARMNGGSLDVRGLLRDAEGPAVLLRAKDQEIYADCIMQITLLGKQPERFIMATQATFDRMMEATKQRREGGE